MSGRSAVLAAPGYWMYEASGVLRPAVEAYLFGQTLTGEHIAYLRAYFRQWIAAPGFQGPEVETLRRTIDGLTTRRAIRDWLDLALDAGIDPL